MRISDWSSDVCSSDLLGDAVLHCWSRRQPWVHGVTIGEVGKDSNSRGTASCRAIDRGQHAGDFDQLQARTTAGPAGLQFMLVDRLPASIIDAFGTTLGKQGIGWVVINRRVAQLGDTACGERVGQIESSQ